MIKNIRKYFRKPLAVAAFVVITLTTVFSTAYVSNNFEIVKNLDIFNTMFRELVINYVDEVNTAELIKTGIDEMLESLDPYTNFIPESQIEDYRFMTTGQYGGIGALIMRRGNYIFISETYEGFPAHKAGLLPGDKILKINDQEAINRTQEEVSSLLKGQPGTEVVMDIQRSGHDEILTKVLVREVVRIDNIPWYGLLDEKTGYIKLTSFTQNAGREVRDAFNSLRNEHEIENLVLDLRGNGGGLLNEAVNITNLFVEKNKIVVETKGKIRERNTTHRTLNNPIDKEIPLVVLVDRASASASEIVAGAIQDFDRGVIIGQRTFGKGLVQNVVPLSYNTQLKITVAKYYIPSGRCIQAIDYAQRHEDGSVAAIPDSLKVAFETLSGRTVYDGGGIEPDIFINPLSLSNLSIALLTNFHIFDYANHYYRNNNEILPADQFEITDEIFNDFMKFLEGKDYSYTTESELYIERLKRVTKDEKYHESIEQELNLIKARIQETKKDDLITFRPEIEMMLKNEIVGRYYKQKGRVISSLNDDPDISEALRVFQSPETYHAILNP
ncbi:MAG: PDZ domain-containing protein [Bacteroidales bacterium]|nr:PDZ domain-containing protein [Bacteroidales bacterium]